MNNFEEKFRVHDFKVHENEFWIWSIRKEQITLGSSVLYLKSNKMSFSDLSGEEMLSLKEMVGVLEATLYSVFTYDRINYLMLMMVDNCVHIHVIPRYVDDRILKGRSFKDKDFPKPPNLFESIDVDEEQLFYLVDYLIENKIKMEQ